MTTCLWKASCHNGTGLACRMIFYTSYLLSLFSSWCFQNLRYGAWFNPYTPNRINPIILVCWMHFTNTFANCKMMGGVGQKMGNPSISLAQKRRPAQIAVRLSLLSITHYSFYLLKFLTTPLPSHPEVVPKWS